MIQIINLVVHDQGMNGFRYRGVQPNPQRIERGLTEPTTMNGKTIVADGRRWGRVPSMEPRAVSAA